MESGGSGVDPGEGHGDTGGFGGEHDTGFQGDQGGNTDNPYGNTPGGYTPPPAPTAAPPPQEGGGDEGGGPGPNPFEGLLMDYLNTLLGITKKRAGYILPTEEELYKQGLEALTTGGVGARIPIIQQAVEQSKQATSRTLAETGAQLDQTKLSGTPFGQRILASLRQAGNQEAAAIPTNEAKQAIALIAGLVNGGTQTITSGLVGGAGVAEQGYAAKLAADVAQAVAKLEAANRIDVANIQATAATNAAQIQADAAGSSAASGASGSAAGGAIGLIGLAALA